MGASVKSAKSLLAGALGNKLRVERCADASDTASQEAAPYSSQASAKLLATGARGSRTRLASEEDHLTACGSGEREEEGEEAEAEDEDEDESKGATPPRCKCNSSPSCCCRSRKPRRVLLLLASLALFVQLVVYLWPLPVELELEPVAANRRPRPKLEGPLEWNDRLGEAEPMFQNEFHAPESMAWLSDASAFYTGVEGGFILRVEPHLHRWHIIARLNAPNKWAALDKSDGLISELHSATEPATTTTTTTTPIAVDGDQSGAAKVGEKKKYAKFCTRDVQLYGKRALTEPRAVYLSRCSRPLGIRLSPDETYLYTVDPMSGLYRIELDLSVLANNAAAAFSDRNKGKLVGEAQVTKLIDFTEWNQKRAARRLEAEQRVLFGDDIAVDWSDIAATQQRRQRRRRQAKNNGSNLNDDDGSKGGKYNDDRIYLTDCSQRWSLRYLLWLMAENDSSGRVLVYESGAHKLSRLQNVTPVHVIDNDIESGTDGGTNDDVNNNSNTGSDSSTSSSDSNSNNANSSAINAASNNGHNNNNNNNNNNNTYIINNNRGSNRGNLMKPYWDLRALSFPNGIELTANKSALLISDLNNRRIIMYHIETGRDSNGDTVSDSNGGGAAAASQVRRPIAGTSTHLLWLPGYPDNIRRGLDSEDGRATYWAACGCAVADGNDWLELTDVINGFRVPQRLGMKWLHVVGRGVEWAGAAMFGVARWLAGSGTPLESEAQWAQARASFGSSGSGGGGGGGGGGDKGEEKEEDSLLLRFSRAMIDFGNAVSSGWLKKDPYCSHGVVLQFDERGQILQTLHSAHRSSYFKILSEAHQVRDTNYEPTNERRSLSVNWSLKSSSTNEDFGDGGDGDGDGGVFNAPFADRFKASKRSHLYLGSVYYSYLGHLRLAQV